jgi:hypothetical protein
MGATTDPFTFTWNDVDKVFLVPKNDSGKKRYFYRQKKNIEEGESGSQEAVKVKQKRKRIRKKPIRIQNNDVLKTTIPFMNEAKSQIGPGHELFTINHFNGEPQFYFSVPKFIVQTSQAEQSADTPPSFSSPEAHDESDSANELVAENESVGGGTASLSGGSDDDVADSPKQDKNKSETEDVESRWRPAIPSSSGSSKQWVMEEDKMILLACRSADNIDVALSKLADVIPNRSLAEVS